MICKKCGAAIEDTSKFCGYCGEKVNNIPEQVPVQKIEQPAVNNVVNNTSLEQTNLNQGATVVEQPVSQPVQPVNQAPVEQVNTNTTNLEPKSPKKKNANKIVFIVLGIVLAVLAVVLVVLAFNKTSNSSVAVLEKALGNLENQGANSGTINAKISIEDNTSNSMNLSAVAKYAKTNDIYDFELTLNKSILFEEMSLYLRVDKDNASLYANSSTIDLLGFTKSDINAWVYYLLDLNEISEDIDISKDEKIDLKGVLDEKHFKYIDKTNSVKHYKLIVDSELLEKLKSKIPNEYSEEIDSEFTVTDSYELDFYINDSNELVRVSMDLTDTIGSDEVKSAVISLDFENFGSTNVVIPEEALNSTINFETYMGTYALESSIEYPGSDIDDSDLDLDMNL